MARKSVGLIYSYNTEWVAGSYYVLNLVHALNRLPDRQKPQLIIFCANKGEYEAVAKTGYPYLRFMRLAPLSSTASWLQQKRHKRDVQRATPILANLDALFPASQEPCFAAATKKVFWIPDFQEHYLPRFFSKEEIANRKRYQKELIATGCPIVFSSQDALADFKHFYPSAKTHAIIMPFAVTHPALTDYAPQSVLDQYKVTAPYFFCANQFWSHKNHMAIIRALSRLKKQGITDCRVVFSGKPSDYRNPDFYNALIKEVHKRGLDLNCQFLGFIDRNDQLILRQQALAVIQPSLFEGWSTVVEDVKSLNQRIILSDLRVHREQEPKNAWFFAPKSDLQLSKLMKQMLVQPPTITKYDYRSHVRDFGETFITIINTVEG